MLAQSNQSESEQNLNADQLSDKETDDEKEVVTGDDVLYDVVVRIPVFQISFIARISEISGLTPQSILAKYIYMGCVADMCEANGDYSDLEKEFGLTKF